MKKIASIIGGGVIGGGWLARFLLNGWNVRVFDPDPDTERKINEVLSNARRTLPMLYDVALPSEGRLQFCDSIEEAVSGVSWIQESVPERLDVKHAVFRQIETFAPGDAIIGSSTSGFKPSQLQDGMDKPGQVLVAHPFNPVYLLPLVELVPGKHTPAALIKEAKQILSSLGMYPLHIRKEIDAHIADRLLEAVWREGLWLINDGIATTEEIDNAIRYGFGLRWAQMGLFETYRIAGGEAGMKHFIAQFGPCLSWPWTKLMDVPALTDELIATISSQSDNQSGALSIRELEQLRDNNLVAVMRALKGQGSAVGALLNTHEKSIRPALNPDGDGLIETIDRTVPVDWTDYNGHMNESRYGQVFSDAADAIMALVGADTAYIASGMSYFTVDIKIAFLKETMAGQRVFVKTRVLQGEGKKLRLFHKLQDRDGTLLATADQMLIHVNLETRRACEPQPGIAKSIEALAQRHAALPQSQRPEPVSKDR